MSPVVDAHHHFWDTTRADYPWMTGAHAPIRRPFGPDDLRPELTAHGIDRTVLVQTRASLAETREFLATAEATDFVAGVVGWVDLAAPDVADRLAELRAGPGGGYLVAIRHQVHDEPDPAWLLRADVQRGLAAVRDAGLAYDLLVRPRELPAALGVARALPDLRLIVDHAAKPPIRSGRVEPWASLMAPLAALPNVACKLSGLVTEANPARWTPADLAPYVERVVDRFGPERLLYGSDWPVCLLAAGYGVQLQALRATLDPLGLGESERVAIFGESAVRWYRLPVA